MTGFAAVTVPSHTGTSGSSQTFITGSPRLFISNQDGISPIDVSFTGLAFQYNSSNSNDIMQAGHFGVPEANTRTKSFMLDETRFTGQHVGIVSAHGNHGALLGLSTFPMSMSKVSLNGQSSFTGTQAITGGSSFLRLQGGSGDRLNGDPGYISISDPDFDESGYRNGISFFLTAPMSVSSRASFSAQTKAPATPPADCIKAMK